MVISNFGGRRYLAYILFLFVPLLMVNSCGKEEKPEEIIRSIR